MDADHTVGEVFNIGSQEEISMVELAGRIRDLANSSSEIVFVPYAEAFGENFEDMPRRVPSLDKIRAAIAYEPTMGLRETLQSVISYCRSLEPTLV
jgi:UDP-glucose 4-epimerase